MTKKYKEVLDKKISFIFESLTQNELSCELGITQWSLLTKIKDNTFDKKELTKISAIYRKIFRASKKYPKKPIVS